MKDKLDTAMILAAGFGTRLGAYTLNTPKALVEYKGKPMIENVIGKLESSGINKIVINSHHFTQQIKNFFQRNSFHADISIVEEEEILGTGGGIKNAEHHLRNSENFLVYNVDVESDINLHEMYSYHLKRNAFATLALQNRDTARPLIIDERMNIIGRKGKEADLIYKKPSGAEKLIGFCGIHIISSQIFSNFTETAFFDIFTAYFRLISEGKKIIGFDIGKQNWKDIGTVENLSA